MLRIEPRLMNVGSDRANSISNYPNYFNKQRNNKYKPHEFRTNDS
jgi:hypothetical protein